MKTLLIFLLCLPVVSWARTIFEPSLSLNNGGYAGRITGSNTIADGTEVSTSYTNFSGGFRYGITREYIHVTAVVDGYLLMNSNDQNIDTNMEFQGNVGIGLGYEWNIPLRTYVVLGLPFSSFELSYFYSESFLVGMKLTRMEMEFAGTEVAYNSYGLTVSFPIEFEYPTYWWRKRDWQ